MLSRIALWFRPLAVALGVFIVLNLALALQRPQLAMTRIWLDAALPEPALSLYAAVLGACLLVPHDMGRLPGIRWVLGGVFAGFGILALGGTAVYYRDFLKGQISTDFPLPLSALVAVVLSFEFLRIIWWRPARSALPASARVFLSMVLTTGAFLVITLAHIVTFGHTDFRRPADAAVIFGAKVYADGTPCKALVDRLDTGIQLFTDGLVRYLIMTGARDPNGRSEPEAMRDYACRKGIPATRILVDETGINTRASAMSCAALARRFSFERLLAVTQSFHCARVRMVFDREGVPCDTVPTCSLHREDSESAPGLSREGYFLLRETVAFPFYLIYYR